MGAVVSVYALDKRLSTDFTLIAFKVFLCVVQIDLYFCLTVCSVSSHRPVSVICIVFLCIFVRVNIFYFSILIFNF